jgi:hypothetical protein
VPAQHISVSYSLGARRFLSFPSTKDPTWDERFPGRSAAEIVTLAPFEWFEQWEDERVMKRGQDYDALKAAFGTSSWFYADVGAEYATRHCGVDRHVNLTSSNPFFYFPCFLRQKAGVADGGTLP